MNCSTLCIIGLVFLIANIYLSIGADKTKHKKAFYDTLTPELKEKLIHGIESQNHDISELKTKRDNSLIEILKIKKENKL